MIVYVSAINIKMSKNEREFSSMIGTKKNGNNTETCHYIFSFLDCMTDWWVIVMESKVKAREQLFTKRKEKKSLE